MTAGAASSSSTEQTSVRTGEGEGATEQCVKQQVKDSASQDDGEPMCTEECAVKRSPQYISCCEDDEEQDLIICDDYGSSRSGSPARSVSDEYELAALSKPHQACNSTSTSSSSSETVPPLPNPLHNAGLLATHIRAIRLEAELQPMRLILSRLMAHQNHNRKGLFNVPVDPTALGLKDYHTVITHPMDLGTIKSKLHSINYNSRQEVAENIRLVFQNAMTYNPPTNPVHVAAQALLTFFEELYAALPGSSQMECGNGPVMAPSPPPPPSKAESSRRVSFADVATLTSAVSEESAASVRAPSPIIARTVSSCEGDCSGQASTSEPQSKPSQTPLPPSSTPHSGDAQNKQLPEENPLSQQITRARTVWELSQSVDLTNAPVKRRLSYAGKNNKGHSCQSCLGRTCSLCDQGCLPLETAALFVCSGAACAGAKIRKNSTFYISEDGSRQYCQRCFAALPPVLSQASHSEPVRYKRDLLKRKNDEELVERWLACSGCQSAVHQICAMHNSFVHGEEKYVCPVCASPRSATDKTNSTFESIADTSGIFTFITGSDMPVRMSEAADSSFRVGKDVLSAELLAETDVSAFIQDKVRTRIAETSGVPDTEKTVVVRIISDCERYFHVPDVVRKHFRMPTEGDDSQVSSNDGVVSPPTKVKYNSKAIALFQKVDGLDVCIFCMYVHEYDGEDVYENDRPVSSKKRVYIAYLDSVEHFRPRSCRTNVYHELLVSYLASARVRGYDSAHIWACPPSRGNSFVFWNHPSSQRTPTKERLISWYHGALSRAIDCGVVTDVKSLYESDFHHHLRDLEKENTGDCSNLSSSGKMPCPPLFEGDFWIEEAVRIHGTSLARHVKNKSSSDLSKMAMMLDEWEPCPARQVSALLEDCVMNHPSSAPFRQPVNAAALKLKDYHKIVTQPMDLGTVNSKCIHGEYHSLGEVVADVKLTFENAKRFNPVGHFVHNMAVELEDFFFQKLDLMTRRWIAEPEADFSWQRFSSMSMSLDKVIEKPQCSTSECASSVDCGSEGRMSPLTEDSSSLAPLSLSSSGDSDETDEQDNSAVQECLESTKNNPPPVGDVSAVTPAELLTGGPDAVSKRMIGDDKWLNDKKNASTSKRITGTKKKRRRTSSPSFGIEDSQLLKRRRQTWLGEEVGASVRSMRTSFFACRLVPHESSLSEQEQDKMNSFARYSSSFSTLEGHSPTVSSRIADARHGLLEFSQFRNFEFDTLRHAKYSTAMLLYHLHNNNAPGIIPICTTCERKIMKCRWHKVVKLKLVDPNRIVLKKKSRSQKSPVDDNPEELCSDCYAKRHNRDQFIPLHVSFHSF